MGERKVLNRYIPPDFDPSIMPKYLSHRGNNAISLEEEAKLREEEDKVDAMKALENRTIDNKVEMDVLDALDEIRAINQRHERVDTAAVLAALKEKEAAKAASASSHSAPRNKDGLTEEDEELLRQFRARKSAETSS
eukprot:gene20327-20920_t